MGVAPPLVEVAPPVVPVPLPGRVLPPGWSVPPLLVVEFVLSAVLLVFRPVSLRLSVWWPRLWKRSSSLPLRAWKSDLRSPSFLTRLRALVTRFLTLRPTWPMRDAMRVVICSRTIGQARLECYTFRGQ